MSRLSSLASWPLASWLLLLCCLFHYCSQLVWRFLGISAVCSFGGLLTFASRKEEDEICSAVVGTNTEDVFALAADKLPVQMTLLH